MRNATVALGGAHSGSQAHLAFQPKDEIGKSPFLTRRGGSLVESDQPTASGWGKGGRGASPGGGDLDLGYMMIGCSPTRASGGEVLSGEVETSSGMDEWLPVAKEWPERNYGLRGSSWPRWCGRRRMDEDGQ
jgi:hypothetical protein